MRLHVFAFSLAAGILWGAAILLVAGINLFQPDYGQAFLAMVSSIYPGYHPGTGFGSLIVGFLYGLVDGAIAGAVLAWIYNLLAPRRRGETA
jgi:cell division protein FtsW (lipid II flippase)